MTKPTYLFRRLDDSAKAIALKEVWEELEEKGYDNLNCQAVYTHAIKYRFDCFGHLEVVAHQVIKPIG